MLKNTTKGEDMVAAETLKLAHISEQNLKDFGLFDASDDKKRTRN